MCADAGTITPPASGQPTFRIDLNVPTCDQGPHALRHEFETGTNFEALEAGDRTTEAMLSTAYDELVAFADQRGTLDPRATAPGAKGSLVTGGLVPALQIKDPVERLSAVTVVGCRAGAAPFSGNTSCPS